MNDGTATLRALGEAKWFLLPVALADMGVCALAVLHHPAWFAVSVFLVLLFVAIALFFRNPARTVPGHPSVLVAPADGLVDAVEDVPHLEVLGGPGKRISIFLSVLDVHLNRAPYEGVLKRLVHTRGEFLDARAPECAIRNENVLWMFETPHGMIGMRQIAGLIARRIVPWAREGQSFRKGEHVGLIRFGSRTDLYLPASCAVAVKVGDRTRGAETVIARWPTT